MNSNIFYRQLEKDEIDKELLELHIKTPKDVFTFIGITPKKGYCHLIELFKDICDDMSMKNILSQEHRLEDYPAHDFYRYRYSEHFLEYGGRRLLKLLGIEVERPGYYFSEIDYYGKNSDRNDLRIWYGDSYEDNPLKILSCRGDACWNNHENFLRLGSLIEALTKIDYLARLAKAFR